MTRPRAQRSRQPGLCSPLAAGLLLVAALATATCGCAGSSQRGRGPGLAAPPLPGASLSGVWHTIAEGESLHQLASLYEVPAQDLVEVNRLPDPDLLLAGHDLFVPGAREVRRGATSSTARLARASGHASRPTHREEAAATGGRFLWPVTKGRLSSRFGRRWGRQHEGIDLAAPLGTPIRAADAGRVIYSGLARGYGKLILLKHDGGFVTVYAHNHQNLVQEGDPVARGQTIAKLGSTGHSTGPHVHFEIRDQGKPVDPLPLLSGPPPTLTAR